MRDVHFFVKYGPDNIVIILGPDFQCIELYPGSEVHLKFSTYEKKKEK